MNLIRDGLFFIKVYTIFFDCGGGKIHWIYSDTLVCTSTHKREKGTDRHTTCCIAKKLFFYKQWNNVDLIFDEQLNMKAGHFECCVVAIHLENLFLFISIFYLFCFHYNEDGRPRRAAKYFARSQKLTLILFIFISSRVLTLWWKGNGIESN
jgi:hypothetical protein